MNQQLCFTIDINKCIDCKTCEMACNEYYGLIGHHRRTVLNFNSNTINLSISCNHCLDPVCVYICPENNFQKRSDGIVVHDTSRCRGCEKCIKSCPFHALKLNPKTNRADKCNFCVDRIDQGLRPICVENCVTGALGMMKTERIKLKYNDLRNADVPIVEYTKPSILIKKRHKGKQFLREG